MTIRVKTNTKTRKHKGIKGGAAIAAGGFGCVFKPALKCKNEPFRQDGVSKVLTTKYANAEMNEIYKIKSIIKKIPNYNDYFIGLDATMCELDKLTPHDMVNLDTKCENLTKKNIFASTINYELDKVKSINLPYGGLEMLTFLNEKKLTPETFIKTNNALIKLLKNGVDPMNKLKLFHNDLKASNILIDNDFNARIIDWGLSGIQKSNEIPNIIRTRPFMFNMPYSICLFNSEFKPFLEETIHSLLMQLNIQSPVSLKEIKQEIKMFMIKWLYEFMSENGQGHYNYISSYVKKLLFIDVSDFPNKVVLADVDSIYYDNIVSLEFVNHYIVDSLTDIVIEYTGLDGIFNEKEYFNNVFKHNADIWGFLTCYTDDFIRALLDDKTNELLVEDATELFYAIKNIAHKYMFNAKQSTRPIDLDVLERDLFALNYIVEGSPPSPMLPATSSINSSRVKSKRSASIHVIPSSPPTPPDIITISSSKSKSKTKSKTSSGTEILVIHKPKKSRKQKAMCDEIKKTHCRTQGKICNELTGRCIKQSKRKNKPGQQLEIVSSFGSSSN